MSNAWRLFVATLLGLGIFPVGGSATDDNVKILVREVGTTMGVPSKILQKKMGEPTFYPIHETRDDGVLVMPERCQFGTFFRAEPKRPMYMKPDDRPCSTEITFDVLTKQYAELIRKATEIDRLKAIAATAGLENLPENLQVALENGDSALVAQISTEIHARLKQQPGLLDPEPYRILALDAGQSAIVETDIVLEPSGPSFTYVLSKDAVSHIKDFQRAHAIGESGRLDAMTLNKLTGVKPRTLYYDEVQAEAAPD